MSERLESHEEALRALAASRGVRFGLPALDAAIRGCRFGDLSLIAGPPHGGKTQVAMHLVLSNLDKRVLWFTPDESHSFLLQKLAAIHFGISQEDVELLAQDKKGRKELVKFTQTLSNLKVTEEGGVDRVQKAVEQASVEWGERPQVLIFDYADLLEHNYGEVTLKQKMTWFKQTGKTLGVAMIVIHQAVKSAIRGSAEPSLADLDYAGHKEATLVLWCRRTPATTPGERLRQQANPSMEAWVLKNKWQPQRPTDAITMYLEPGGRLRTA